MKRNNIQIQIKTLRLDLNIILDINIISNMSNRKVSKNLKSYVNKQIKKTVNKSQQTKRSHTQFNEETIQSGTTQPEISWVTHCDQGIEEDDRIGNQVTSVGLRLRMLFHAKVNPEDNARGTWMRIAFIAVDNEDFTSIRTKLFNKNGAVLGYTGATGVERYYLPFNEMNRKVIYQKTFRLAAPYAGETFNANRLVKHYRKYSKKMIFESNLTDLPTHRVAFVYFIGNTNFDADVPGEPSQVEVSGGITFYYKDA